MQQDIQQDILHTYIVHVVVELFVDKVAVRQTSKSLLIVCTANCANLARACGSAHRRQRSRQQRCILCQRTCSPVEGLQHWVCLRHRRRRCRFRPHGVPVQQQHARSQITATDMRSLPACSTSPICSPPSFQGDAAVLTSRTQSPCEVPRRGCTTNAVRTRAWRRTRSPSGWAAASAPFSAPPGFAHPSAGSCASRPLRALCRRPARQREKLQ